jgi:hypothetical protein
VPYAHWRERTQVAENGGHGEAGITAFANDSLHVRSVDPVHDEHVAVVEEEVVAYGGERRMRSELQERAPLGPQLLARLVGSEPADLQRHGTVVPPVDRAHHLGVAAVPEHLEQLVSIADDPCHAWILRAGFRRRCSAFGLRAAVTAAKKRTIPDLTVAWLVGAARP